MALVGSVHGQTLQGKNSLIEEYGRGWLMSVASRKQRKKEEILDKNTSFQNVPSEPSAVRPHLLTAYSAAKLSNK